MIIYIKYMVSLRCKILVKQELEKLGIYYVVINLGSVELLENITAEQRTMLKEALLHSGLEVMDDKRAILIEKIRCAIIERIHHTDSIVKINFSVYLSKKLEYDYTYLANIFSEVKGITIEKYIITHKIERVKELIIYNELNLTEISYKMDYSSVAALSNQFKKVTGLTPTFFKHLAEKRKVNIEDV